MSKLDVLLIRFILRWRPPQSVGSFNLDDPSNNYAFVKIASDHPDFEGANIDVLQITDGKIIGKQRGGENVSDVQVPVAEITDASYKVILHKGGWNLWYTSLKEAAFDLAGGFYLKRITQTLYDRRLTEYDDQIGVLKAATALRKARLLSEDETMTEIVTGNSPIGRDELLRKIYGNKINLSPMYYAYLKALEISIDAWIESGEFAKASDNPASTRFIVKPKALNTLAEHQLNMRKHWDSIRPAWIAALAAAVAAAVTMAQLYFVVTSNDSEPDSYSDK